MAMAVKKNSLLPGGGLQQLSAKGKEKTRQRTKHKLCEIRGKFAVVIINTEGKKRTFHRKSCSRLSLFRAI